MSLAAQNGHKEIVELLLARNDVNINEKTPGSRNLPEVGALSNAAMKGHTKIVELLLARNDIDVNAGKLLGVPADQEYKSIMQLMTLRLMKVHH